MRTRVLLVLAVALVVGSIAVGAAGVEPEHTGVLNDPNGSDGNLFGYSVAIDGDTMVVGTLNDHDDRGAVHVFTRTNGVWTHGQELTGAYPAEGDRLGESVAIDGDTIVAGAPYAAGDTATEGEAHVFVRDPVSGVWSHYQELTDEDAEAGDDFGFSVAIDGDTIVVGAPLDDGPDHDCGAAHVFRRNPDTGIWEHSKTLADPDTAGCSWDEFGRSVAIDGANVVIGAPFDAGAGYLRGAVHVFRSQRGGWTHAKLIDPMAANEDRLGSSVAIEGDTIVAGAPAWIGGTVGAVHVFVQSGGVWAHDQQVGDPDANGPNRLGASVAIDGDTVVAGAPYDGAAGGGTVHVFARAADVWTHALELADPEAADGDNLGRSVALDGDTIVAGAPYDDGVGENRGVVHLFGPACGGKAVTLFVPPGGSLFEGTAGNDVILGTAGADWISGKGGDDTICGLGGDDLILGGPGDDTLLGGDGNDKLRGAAGDDTLRGEAGSDRMLPEAGNDLANGGPGSDIVDYLAADGPVSVNLPAGTAAYSPIGGPTWTHTLVLVEKADGSPFNDTLIGDAKRNVLRGKHGTDTILGGDGDDDLIGGLEVDEIHGGSGADLVKGQAGDDLLWGDDDADKLVGGSGNDTLSGGPGDDLLIGGLWSHLGTFVNTLDGGDGFDTCRWEAVTTNCP